MKRMRYLLFWSPLLLAAMLMTTSTRSETLRDKQKDAEALFAQASKLGEKGNFDAACSLLQRAWTLDPTDGTLFALADCREKEGKIGTALRLFRQYLERAQTRVKTKSRALEIDWAKKRIPELERDAPTLRVSWKAEPTRDVKIVVDGSEIMPNRVEPFDPGSHQVNVERSGTVIMSRSVTLNKGEQTVEVLPGIEVAPRIQPPRRWQPMEIAAVGAISTGGVAVIAGSIFGGLAIARKATVDTECDINHICSDAGWNAVHDTARYGDASSGLLIGGAAVAVAGFTMWLVAQKHPKREIHKLEAFVNTGRDNVVVGLKGAF